MNGIRWRKAAPGRGALGRYVDGMRLNRVRWWIQLACFGLMMYGGHLGLDWGRSLPVLACGYDGQNRLGICYLMPFQTVMGMRWENWLSGPGGAALLGFAAFVAWFLVLNRAWCGYVCPFGTIQDWISALRRGLGIRGGSYVERQRHWVSRLKYVFLAFAILAPLGASVGLFAARVGRLPFCQLCPFKMLAPLFTGEIDTLVIDFTNTTTVVLTSLGMVTTGAFLVGAFVKKRFWCFVCPMAALQYLMSKSALLRLVKEGDKCTRCGDCYRVCDMNILEIADDVVTRDIMTSDCTMCLKCIAACPEDGALKLTFCGATVLEATAEGFVKRMGKG